MVTFFVAQRCLSLNRAKKPFLQYFTDLFSIIYRNNNKKGYELK